MAAVASAAIRKLQHDSRHRSSSHPSDIDNFTEILLDANHSSCATTPDADSMLETSSSENVPYVPSISNSQQMFSPVQSSTPRGKSKHSISNQQTWPPTQCSSGCSTDTESSSNPGRWDDQSPCAPSDLTSTQPPFRAPILGYEIMEQRAKFTVYKINVQHIPSHDSWFVFRRYTDFSRVNKKLKDMFPCLRLTLPPKRLFKDNFEPAFLEARILGLQNFVNSLLSQKEIWESLPVREFLCLDDPPGPNDCLEDSRLRCESLEELVSSLQMELDEKQAEIDVLKAELALSKLQRSTLLKSLRIEESSTLGDRESSAVGTQSTSLSKPDGNTSTCTHNMDNLNPKLITNDNSNNHLSVR